MQNHFFLACGGAALLVTAGCAWVHQTATLKLEPTIAPSNLGNGTAIALRVIDKRATTILGYRGLDSKNASITTEQDVAGLFREKLLNGLARKGFVATPYAELPGRVLTVEIRQIEYSTDLDFWKGIVLAKASLRVVTSREGTVYDQTYVAERKVNTIEAPHAKTNEELINGAISDVVQRLFEDERLILFLAN